jgi:invasion protein IalB
MPSRVAYIRLVAFAVLLVAPAASAQDGLPALTYSPWTKFCIGEMCFIGSDVRTECAVIFAAVLVENAKDPKKILRITLPTSVNRERGARIAIDQAPPISRPFVQCYASGCMADDEGGTELVDQLKQGQILAAEAVDAANSPITRSLPLAGFAAAYDGPAQEPKVFELQPEKLQKELQERADAARRGEEPPKQGEQARNPRCETK